MREIRSSGSVEGVVRNHDPYSDSCRPAVMPVVAMVRGEKTQVRRTCYEMKKEGFNLRPANPPARKAGPLPVRIYGFPKDAGEKAFGGSELPLHVSAFGPRSMALLGGWSLFSLIYLQEGCET